MRRSWIGWVACPSAAHSSASHFGDVPWSSARVTTGSTRARRSSRRSRGHTPVGRVTVEHRVAEALECLLLGLAEDDDRADALLVEELLRYRRVTVRLGTEASVHPVRLEVLEQQRVVLSSRSWAHEHLANRTGWQVSGTLASSE
jgi:hypothetical protein